MNYRQPILAIPQTPKMENVAVRVLRKFPFVPCQMEYGPGLHRCRFDLNRKRPRLVAGRDRKQVISVRIVIERNPFWGPPGSPELMFKRQPFAVPPNFGQPSVSQTPCACSERIPKRYICRISAVN
jgi:hypothetical protein